MENEIKKKVKKKILIIDDDLSTRHLIVSTLNHKGFPDTLTAATGQEGLEAVKKEKPDIVILDVVLPDMTGYDICKEIKSMTDTMTKVILITAQIGDVNHGAASEAQPDYFLVKTPDYNSLIQAIRNLSK